MCKCIKARFLPLHTLKNIVLKKLILVVWKYAQMQQNTFTTTSDVKKLKTFLSLCFWWSESMRKCTKTRFLPHYTLKMQKRKNTFILRT
jgi:hypothetical protein